MKQLKLICVAVLILSFLIGVQAGPVLASDPLPKVTSLKAVVTEDKRIKLTWNNAYNANSYTILVTKTYDQVDPDKVYEGTFNPMNVCYFDPVQESQYYFFISYEYLGVRSLQTWTYVDYKTPHAPSNLKVGDAKWYGAATLTWSDYWPYETGWVIDVTGADPDGHPASRRIELAANNDLDRSVVITTPLKPEGYYTFLVWAKNGGLVGPVKQVAAYMPMCPPTNVAASATLWNTGPGVELMWKDNSINDDHFQIERTNPDGTKVLINETLGDGWWADEGLKYFSKYIYRIRAVSTNAAYDSEWSEPVTVTTSKMPIKFISSMYAKPTKPSFAMASSQLSEILAAAAAAAATEPAPDSQPPPDSQPLPADPTPANETSLRYYIGKMEYYVNNIQGNMDAVPVILNSRTMLPIRYVAEPLGAVADWNPAEQKVTITLGAKVIELWIGNSTAKVNGVDTLIDPVNPNVKPVILPPGRTMVPLRFIGEILGCEVLWNQVLQEATLTKAQ